MPISIFRTHSNELILRHGETGAVRVARTDFTLDVLFQSADPETLALDAFHAASAFEDEIPEALSAPIGNQEVWAAGVTYYRSRTARMEEAESAGGDVFYDKVYEAERPELFFKATSARTRGTGAPVCIRSDSSWDVPEPELTLAISSRGEVFGYTIGNDMSSRSIEGENPLYLPQAKVYTGSCSLGPCLLVGKNSIDGDSTINMEIYRKKKIVFSSEIQVSQLKRKFDELAGFLYRCNAFPEGAYLMTGTGIVPDSDFTLKEEDSIFISIQGIGTLANAVEVA